MHTEPYHDWLRKVDGMVIHRTGLSYLDMGDQPWFEWWEQGIEPSDAAGMALKAEGYKT